MRAPFRAAALMNLSAFCTLSETFVEQRIWTRPRRQEELEEARDFAGMGGGYAAGTRARQGKAARYDSGRNPVSGPLTCSGRVPFAGFHGLS